MWITVGTSSQDSHIQAASSSSRSSGPRDLMVRTMSRRDGKHCEEQFEMFDVVRAVVLVDGEPDHGMGVWIQMGETKVPVPSGGTMPRSLYPTMFLVQLVQIIRSPPIPAPSCPS
jgi:hypothetical protein